MASVDDSAAFLLERCGTMTTYKLHKLLYYAQGWSLAWDGKPLFDAKIKAYENGPVVSSLFGDHRGSKHLSRWHQGDSSRLTEDEMDTLRAVVDRYGSKTPEELVQMTHAEPPWVDVWNGDRSVKASEITIEAMRSFFSSLASRPVHQSAKSLEMGQRLRTFVDGEIDPDR